MNNIIIKLAKLIHDNAKMKKIPDSNFANKVIELLINHFDANGYVNNAYIADMGNNYLCGYDYYEKTIYIDMDNLYQHILDDIEKEKEMGLLNIGDYTYLRINLNFVNSVAHEVFHARQYKKVASDKNDLEKELLELSFENNCLIMKAQSENRLLNYNEVEFIKALNKLEEDKLYYNALPSERMANINAFKLGEEISKCYDDDLFSLYTNIKHESYKGLGYLGEGQYPTPYILTYHNKLKNTFGITENSEESFNANITYYRIISSNNNLTVDEKMYYGLPINSDTFYNYTCKVNNLIKKLVDKK